MYQKGEDESSAAPEAVRKLEERTDAICAYKKDVQKKKKDIM